MAVCVTRSQNLNSSPCPFLSFSHLHGPPFLITHKNPKKTHLFSTSKSQKLTCPHWHWALALALALSMRNLVTSLCLHQNPPPCMYWYLLQQVFILSMWRLVGFLLASTRLLFLGLWREVQLLIVSLSLGFNMMAMGLTLELKDLIAL
jgi:hypothetical protein